MKLNQRRRTYESYIYQRHPSDESQNNGDVQSDESQIVENLMTKVKPTSTL